MTNDINTLNGSLSELGETMADNLVSMGVVDASASDGLTTLAGRILDIEPSIGGLDLDTAVTISSSESSISLGSSIVLTSKLTASYDDETIVDVDLSGVLQNATLLFKNGNTTIGTAVTDVNGVATFTYTPPSVGTLSLKAIFAGTDNFNNCESSFINVTVVAPSYDDIVLTADDSILSYYDGDSTTLRAQLMDGSSTASVSGVTVEFFNGSTSLGTAQTDSTGMATKTYTSTGAGDVSLKAEADNGTLSSEIYVEDCLFYDSATSDKTSKYSTLNADSFTHTTDCYSLKRILGESSTTKYYTPVYLTDFTLPSDYEISVDISTDTISQEMLNIVSSPVQTYQGVSEFGVLSTAVRYGLFKRVSGTGTFYTTNGSLNTNEFYTFKVRVNGTSVTDTITDSNGVQKHTNTQSISQTSDFHKFTIVNGGKAHTVKFKNLKVKAL